MITFIYRFCTEGVGMTNRRSDSRRGGYSVYFNRSSGDSCKDAEFNVVRRWVEQVTLGKIRIFTKPDDRILRNKVKDSAVIKIEELLKRREKTGSEGESTADSPIQNQTVLLILPVHTNLINVAEYIKTCVLQFCEENFAHHNGKEVICVASVNEMSPTDVAQLVHELHVALESHDTRIFSCIVPNTGHVTCLCLHVNKKVTHP